MTQKLTAEEFENWMKFFDEVPHTTHSLVRKGKDGELAFCALGKLLLSLGEKPSFVSDLGEYDFLDKGLVYSSNPLSANVFKTIWIYNDGSPDPEQETFINHNLVVKRHPNEVKKYILSLRNQIVEEECLS